jgi:crossover junction endodeoxyribonuclease RuvC
MIFVGVDPGKTGGIAVINSQGHLLTTSRMPTEGSGKEARVDPNALHDILARTHGGVVCIEQVSGFSGQGGQFAFGYAAAVPWVVARIIGLPIRFVRPTQWSVLVGRNIGTGAARKRNVIAKARDQWPEANLGTMQDSGIADALFIAEYVRRTEKGI